MLPHEFGHFVSPGEDSPDDELTEREVEGLGQAGLVVGRPLMGGRGDDTVGCQGRHEGRYLVDGKISNFGGQHSSMVNTHALASGHRCSRFDSQHSRNFSNADQPFFHPG